MKKEGILVDSCSCGKIYWDSPVRMFLGQSTKYTGTSVREPMKNLTDGPYPFSRTNLDWDQCAH